MTEHCALPGSFKAAVVRQPGGPFELETVQLNSLQPHEVVVRIVATGMCHTDMVARDRLYPIPQPIVLGHEGAGVVEAVGAEVQKVVPGDHVVLTFLSCGACRPCLEGVPASCQNFNALNFSGQRSDGSHALCHHGNQTLHDRFFGQSSFAAFSVVDQRNLVKVRPDAPLELLGPLGCGIQTGAGAVLNALKVAAGSSFAAFGGGTVGLSGVMAAYVAGATTIIVIDVVEERLALARELGATHVINSKKEDPVEAIRHITGDGVDFSLESTGRPEIVRAAVEALRPRGMCGIVGASKTGTTFALDMNDVMQNCKVLRGIVEGDSIPDIFIPQLVELYVQGRFPLDKLIRFYPFEEINQAAHDSECGKTIKPVIRIG